MASSTTLSTRNVPTAAVRTPGERRISTRPMPRSEPVMPSMSSFWMNSTAAGAAPPTTFSRNRRANPPGACRMAISNP